LEDPSKSWLFGDREVAKEQWENSRKAHESNGPLTYAVAKLLPSPEVQGVAQRVIQVCVGTEHGVLLTDAGVAFTWGDNRYGQLGRVPEVKQESKRPFPVLALLQHEVLQVASGDHHCLALVAPGLVWAWGRNKGGQCGTGDTRDKCKPQKVIRKLEPAEDPEEGKVQLGLGPKADGNKGRERIITLSAGGRSSVAAAYDSTIWQWGEVSANFKIVKPAQQRTADGDLKADPSMPYKVYEKASFLTNLRKGAHRGEKISEIGGRVLVAHEDHSSAVPGAPLDTQRVKDMVTSLHQLQESITDGRVKLDQMNSGRDAEDGGKGGEAGNLDKFDFEETIAVYKRDVEKLKAEIDMLAKAQKSLELQQEGERTHRQNINKQLTELHSAMDREAASRADRKSVEAEEKERRLKLSIEANHTAKETLERQFQQTNEEKSAIQTKIKAKIEEREKLDKKLATLDEVSKSLKSMAGASDELVVFLKEKCDEFRRHFESGRDQLTFEQFEEDENFLRGMEDSVHTTCSASTQAERLRSNLVKKMLYDLISLRRIWNELLRDKLAKEDLNFDKFF